MSTQPSNALNDTALAIAAVSGNPRAGSRTALAARVMASTLAEQFRAGGERAPLPVVPIELADHITIATADAAPAPIHPLERAVHQVTQSDLIVIASPAYKGTATALLKVLFEQFGPTGLAGRTVVPVGVGGQAEHAAHVVGEIGWVASQVGAQVPAPGLALVESELVQLESLVDRWVAQHGRAVVDSLTATGLAA